MSLLLSAEAKALRLKLDSLDIKKSKFKYSKEIFLSLVGLPK